MRCKKLKKCRCRHRGRTDTQCRDFETVRVSFVSPKKKSKSIDNRNEVKITNIFRSTRQHERYKVK